MNTKAPIGYLIAGLHEAASVLAAAEMFAITLIMILGFCHFLFDFMSDIEINLSELNDKYISEHHKKSLTSDKRITIIKQLDDTLRFHVEARELSSFSIISTS